MRILLINGATETNRNAAIISSSQGKTVPIVKGSTGNRTYVASWEVSTYKILGSGASYTGSWGYLKTRYAYMGNSVSFVDNDTSLHLESQSSYGNGGGVINVYSTKTVNVTDYNRMYFTISGAPEDANVNAFERVGLIAKNRLNLETNNEWCPIGWTYIAVGNTMVFDADVVYASDNTTCANGTHYIDISGLSGEYYVVISQVTDTHVVDYLFGYDITDIYLKK